MPISEYNVQTFNFGSLTTHRISVIYKKKTKEVTSSNNILKTFTVLAGNKKSNDA